jgi:hypothetical protein
MRMNVHDSNNDITSCWVCVLQDTNTNAFHINYTRNIQQYTQQYENSTLKLIYYRGFHEIIDGLGHKLFLETLSPNSIKRFVTAHNNKLNEYTINI